MERRNCPSLSLSIHGTTNRRRIISPSLVLWGECGDGGEGNILKEDVLLLQNTESQIQSSQPTFQGKQSESKVDSYPKLITLPG